MHEMIQKWRYNDIYYFLSTPDYLHGYVTNQYFINFQLSQLKEVWRHLWRFPTVYQMKLFLMTKYSTYFCALLLKFVWQKYSLLTPQKTFCWGLSDYKILIIYKFSIQVCSASKPLKFYILIINHFFQTTRKQKCFFFTSWLQ